MRITLPLLLLLVGCGPDATITMTRPTPIEAPTPTNRFGVELVAVFKDALAYDGKRGIYIITDSDGKQFIGVSGIGIAERASHSSGKSSRQDER